MATYEIETEDGKVYEIETEDVNKTNANTTSYKSPNVGFSEWATKPLISKESILGSTIGKVMAGSSPITQIGGAMIPPPISQFVPPQIRQNQTAELISSETSPLAIASNALMLKGMQGQKEIPKLLKLGGRNTAQKIAESADRGLDSIGKTLSNKYDSLFNKIGTGETTNAPVFEAIRGVIDTYPEAAGVPKLKKIMDRLRDADTISAKELHDLKQVVRKSIPKSVWSGTTEADAIQNAMRDIYFTITDSLEKIGGKEYAGLSQEYRKVKEAEKLAKKAFYKNGVPSNEALNNKIDIPTERAIGTLDKMLPTEDRFANEFNAWKRGQAVKKFAAPLVGTGLVGYMAHRYITDRTMRGN